ncbi:MAG: hypothetical protein HOH19_00590, partial [Kordiimonadaceae bacterium]|nr:hypothetical protein [Kordiimonadaceae bacterium]
MKSILALLTLFFSLSIETNAQTYEFTGTTTYRDATQAAAFGNATTFIATLVFDTTQTTAGSPSSPGNYDLAWYNYTSFSFSLGGETWSHADSDVVVDGVIIQDGLSGTYADESLTIRGNSNQSLVNGYTVDSSLISALDNDGNFANPIFSSANAVALLSFNDLATNSGRILGVVFKMR